MTKELFIKIQTALEAHISSCQLYLSGINTTDDLKNLTLGQAQELQRFCKAEESAMTKFAQGDLYHLIGMGELTPPQMMKLTYLTKDWLQYRSTIKTWLLTLSRLQSFRDFRYLLLISLSLLTWYLPQALRL